MTKKTKLIPFNWHLYKAGLKVNLKNITNIIGKCEVVDIYENALFDEYLVIFSDGNGKISNIYTKSCHLELEQEIEEKTFYVIVYENGVHEFQSDFYTAKKRMDMSSIGMLKVTYTEEDLIK